MHINPTYKLASRSAPKTAYHEGAEPPLAERQLMAGSPVAASEAGNVQQPGTDKCKLDNNTHLFGEFIVLKMSHEGRVVFFNFYSTLVGLSSP